MLKYFEIKKAFRYYIKQIDFMLLCVCSVIHHRRRQNVVRASVTHLTTPRVPLFCSYHIFMSSVSITEQMQGNMESIKQLYMDNWYLNQQLQHELILGAKA